MSESNQIDRLVMLLNEAADELALFHRDHVRNSKYSEGIPRVTRLLKKIEKSTGHTTISPYPDNAKISDGTPQAESDCSSLRERISELEDGLRQIAVWKQEDQDDHEICVRQWRGCVAIARALLKPTA